MRRLVTQSAATGPIPRAYGLKIRSIRAILIETRKVAPP